MPGKWLVGMSGGVDSSVAAWLMKEQGCQVLGATLRLVESPDSGTSCQPSSDMEDARRVAEALGIEHRVCSLTGCFRTRVMDPFAAAYERGETPNPCIDCNRAVKFPELLRLADEAGCDGIATGHYARIERSPSGRWLLKRAVHPDRDQSYFLYPLTQAQLSRVRFPLGELSKREVRDMAGKLSLPTARKRDSQDICFVPDGDYAAFIRRHTGKEYPPGPFVDKEGRELGRHRGIICYTLGQRKGLGLALPAPVYVCGKDLDRNAVILGSNGDLMRRELDADHINLIACDSIPAPLSVAARIRHSRTEEPAVVEQTGPDRIHVVFDRPQRAVTPGQAVVLYDGDVVIGGGTIL